MAKRADESDRRRVLPADILAVGVIWLLILLFLAPAFRPGQVLLPLDIVTGMWPPWQQAPPPPVHNPLMSDVVNYIFPAKQFAAQAVRDGTLPLWNPYVLTGYPFTYNTQAAVYYPLSLLYYTLPAATAVDATIALQMALGGLFMYAYLRQIGLQPLSAQSGAVIFLFNGLMVVWLEWQVVHAAIIWLPLQLLFIERLHAALATPDLSRSALRSAVGGGLALALPWLGGHWNWTLYVSMTAAVYLILRLIAFWHAAGRPRLLLFRLAAYAAVLLGVGVATSLIQVLPALLYLGQSHRRALPFQFSLSQGLLNRAVVLLLPNFFGDPIRQNWWGPDNYAETTLYLGIFSLWLGLLSLRRRDWHTRFFAGWGVLGLLWTLGTPAYGLLYALPPFRGLIPSRAAVLVVFAVAVLAGLGLDGLLSLPAGLPKSRWGCLGAVLAGGSGMAVLAYAAYYQDEVVRTWDYLRPHIALFAWWLMGSTFLLMAYGRGWLGGRGFAGLALLWIVADLFVFGRAYNPVTSVSHLYPPTRTTQFLQAESGREHFRITTPPAAVALPPNTTLVPRIANLSGYEPGILRRLVNYVNAAEGASTIYSSRTLVPVRALASPLLDALNVKYLVSVEDWWGESLPAWKRPAVTAWRPLPLDISFTMPEAGLHRIEIPMRPTHPTQDAVVARLLTADGNREVAHARLPAAGVDGEAWAAFDFAPLPADSGQTFRLRLEGDGQTGVQPDGSAAFLPFYRSRPPAALEVEGIRLYLNEGYLPRAFAVSRAVVIVGEAAALQAVQAHAGELDEVVVLESESPPAGSLPAAGDGETAVRSSTGASEVVITAYEINRVQLQAEMAAPGFVVLADSYYPGWQATVDGVGTPVYRANSVLRAVEVPAGVHEIVFLFRPPDFIVGALGSGLALLLSVAAFGWSYRPKQGRQGL